VTTTIDLADPGAFLDGAPHDDIAVLRRTDPVHFQPMVGEPGFWAVLRHADVVHVARHPEVFSASAGGVVVEDLGPEQLEMMRHMLLAMDPPVHTDHRRPMSEHFKARVIAHVEDQIRDLCRAILGDADGEDEFVHDVPSQLPSRVIGQLMGLPSEDWPRIHAWAEQATSGQDPDVGAADDSSAGAVEIAMYAIEFAARRRTMEPQPDLTSVILDTEFGGEPMSDIDFGSFFAQLVIAGNYTTIIMLSSGLSTLLDHPDQLAELRADPSLTADAVEEILRYANPLH
jgi:cytochrome P450